MLFGIGPEGVYAKVFRAVFCLDSHGAVLFIVPQSVTTIPILLPFIGEFFKHLLGPQRMSFIYFQMALM